MTAPTNTYDSNTDLSLGQVPDVEDEDMYIALLDIHNAIESLLKGSDNNNAIFTAYIDKQRSFKLVTSDYTVLATDGLVLTDTSAGDITITLPALDSSNLGYTYDIKQIAGTNETLVIGDSGDPVDDDAGGITLDLLEAIPIKNDGTKWWINN